MPPKRKHNQPTTALHLRGVAQFVQEDDIRACFDEITGYPGSINSIEITRRNGQAVAQMVSLEAAEAVVANYDRSQRGLVISATRPTGEPETITCCVDYSGLPGLPKARPGPAGLPNSAHSAPPVTPVATECGKRLFVGGLSKGPNAEGAVGTTQQMLEDYFSAFGTVTWCQVMHEDQGAGPSKGFGFVEFASEEEARQVLTAGPHYIDTCKVTVRPAGEQSKKGKGAKGGLPQASFGGPQMAIGGPKGPVMFMVKGGAGAEMVQLVDMGMGMEMGMPMDMGMGKGMGKGLGKGMMAGGAPQAIRLSPGGGGGFGKGAAPVARKMSAAGGGYQPYEGGGGWGQAGGGWDEPAPVTMIQSAPVQRGPAGGKGPKGGKHVKTAAPGGKIWRVGEQCQANFNGDWFNGSIHSGSMTNGFTIKWEDSTITEGITSDLIRPRQ
eukprot:TRINITY_DN8738_c3_g1_i1.p1 TRINITY_DN8738_c3_g1~~TRINITY_DN8738_c3_g1_i1.p1  ORF type:complete len:438 (+),score=90.03 TRINITY_DN8738_c3_g1_i1:107-1420(+)